MDPRSIRLFPLLTLQMSARVANMTDANLVQTRNILAVAAATADAARRAVAESCGAAIRAHLVFGDHMFARAHTTMEANFDLASALARSRTNSEVFEAVAAHVRRQFDAIASRSEG